MDELPLDVRPDLFDNINPNTAPEFPAETPAGTPAEEKSSGAEPEPAVPAYVPAEHHTLAVPDTPAPHPASPVGEDTRLCGLYLRELREYRGLTLAQVADETRIKPVYLEQLEENHLEKQHPVYTMAYLKKLVRLYRADIEDFSGIVSLLRNQLPYEPPADIGKSVVEHEADEEEQKKLHQLALIFSGIAVIVVLALVISAVLLLLNLRNGSTPGEAARLDEAHLLEMQETPSLGITPLPRRNP